MSQKRDSVIKAKKAGTWQSVSQLAGLASLIHG